MIIGMLPASGKASRINGIPKFCLPVQRDLSLIQWHINQMSEVCDIVRVCTKKEWAPIIENLNMNIELSIIEPSTMCDAILKMGANDRDTFLVGMPDTIVLNSKENFYRKLLERPEDLVLASWKFYEGLRGLTAQIEYDSYNMVTNIIDKDPSCNFKRNWGAFKFQKICRYFDKYDENISNIFLSVIQSEKSVSMIKCKGKFIDAGTMIGLKELYSSLNI